MTAAKVQNEGRMNISERVAAHYRIRIRGHLDPAWSTMFDGLTITNVECGEALIHGPIVDQAALYGVLIKVRDLGLTLIGVCRVPAAGPPA